MDDHRRLPAEKLDDLSPAVKQFLDELRLEEVEALRMLVRLGPEGVAKVVDTIKLVSSAQTVGRFTRAVIIFVVGIFLGTVLLAKQVSEAFTWIRSHF